MSVALSAGDTGTPTLGELYVKSGTSIRAWLVVEARLDGKTVYFSEAPKIRRGRRSLKTKRWNDRRYGAMSVRFGKLEPEVLDNGIYDNTGTMEKLWHPIERMDHPKKWHWCHIDYLETMLGKASRRWSRPVDSQPTGKKRRVDYGTMRYIAQVKWGGRVHWTHSKTHRDKGGLRRGIATVRVRRDDTTVGYMTELMNVPYVYGSSSTSGRMRDHQTERAVGADCADLIVYGWRRAGRKIDYTWTQGLKSHTFRTADVTDLRAGRYRKGTGRPLKFGRDVDVGDIILWRRHVAVVAEKDPSGYLTPKTPIFHTVMETPALTPLSHIGFGFDSPPFEVRRPNWKKKKKKRTRKRGRRRARRS